MHKHEPNAESLWLDIIISVSEESYRTDTVLSSKVILGCNEGYPIERSHHRERRDSPQNVASRT